MNLQVPRKVLNSLVHFLAPYEQAVEELKLKLKGIKYGFQKSGRYSPIEFVVGRVKKADSLFQKAKEKGIDFTRDDWEEALSREITDIAGLRVVCRYIDDVREVEQLLHEREDIQVVDVKDYITNPKESGYRSIHMIATYTVYHGSEKKTLFCEIQIRTLGMNFWATNEHELRYKYAGKIPENVLLQLNEAAAIAHQLDVLMNNLRQEILKPAPVDNSLEEKLEEIFSLFVKQDLESAAALYREHLSGYEGAFADNPKFKMIYDLIGKRLGH
ncbi:MAG: GTP pyrophosphokinase family protein [Brevibacillus sp.]|nr:GTP pyrophosphokinase family protein [Brevibacillus sp.]